jgi:drug/metabolite transporter (DMT)-like permease
MLTFSAADGGQHTNAVLIRFAPVVMVLLWSTGFIGTKLSLYYGEPFTLLLWRCAITAAVMAVVGLLMKAPWPRDGKSIAMASLVGICIHGFFLSGSYLAVSQGVTTGIVALIVGVQPLLTAVAAGVFLGEQVTKRQWSGLFLGFIGVVMVISNKFSIGTSEFNGTGFAVMSLFGMTIGTLIQKRYGSKIDMRTNMVIQFTAASMVCAVFAVLFETMEVHWSGELILVQAWLVFALSIGAVAITYALIKLNSAFEVGSLFYLIPPVVAVLGFLFFGETLDIYGVLGMGVAVSGVALVTRN